MLSSTSTASLTRARISAIGLLRMVVDPLVIAASLLLCCALAGIEFGGAELLLLLIAFALSFPGEVSVRRIRRGLFGDILLNWLLIALLLLFLGYATRFIGHFDRQMLIGWLLLTPALQYAAHRAIPLLLPQLLAIDGSRSAVVVASNDVGRRLAAQLRDEPALGFRFRGFFVETDRHGAASSAGVDGPVLGTVAEVAERVRRDGIDTVFIALPMAAQPSVLQLLDDLRDTTASVYFVPDIFISDLIQARIDDVGGIPVVAVCETPFVGISGVVKRVSDLLIASLALLLLAPLMLAIAVGVRLSSPGPALFRQRRYGVDGREIMVLKFRSMTVAEDGADVRQACRGDARVTPLGAFIRRTSIDELPQLFNVLAGTMSMVGPRPHAVAHNEFYRREIKGYMVRHKVRPGITGWAQVNGLRGGTDTVEQMRRRIEYDLDYLRHWSLRLDLLILLRTLRVVLSRTNAY
jgi:putative colanic acid biosynthesis UDP-glucose lipid carrier transferase